LAPIVSDLVGRELSEKNRGGTQQNRRHVLKTEASMKILKFLFVDSTVNILGDLFEQPWAMWAFIGWGWLSVLVMIASIIQTLPTL
jgi:hypothetical protein